MPEPIRVLVVDDHPVVRQGLRTFLDLQDDLTVIGEAADGEAAVTAADDLRLACFGMLDEPRQLADCLARLALAQDRLDDVNAFRETFQRLVEIEERFKAYSQTELAPELRAGLEQRLAARIPATTLAGAPAFR